MERTPKSAKASTASSADNITLDVQTPVITGKTSSNGTKPQKMRRMMVTQMR